MGREGPAGKLSGLAPKSVVPNPERALYRAELAAGGNPMRLQQLVDIGRMLHTALELSRVEPDTIGHCAAWGWAGKAVTALGAFIGEDMALAPLLRATAAKLRR